MAKASAEPLVLLTVKNAIATVTFNRPARCNAWSQEMMDAIRDALSRCAADDAVRGAIITGAGNYYCSGVDFAGGLEPMAPSKFKVWAAKQNEALFDIFLDFPKPLICAVNGPAIGAGVTSSALCDAVLVSPTATFHTPFRALGITPEGCSSVNFPRMLGPANAAVLLEEGRKITAAEAKEFGLAIEVVESQSALMERAQAIAEEWVASGRGRKWAQEPEWLEKLRRANAEESVALAASFLQRPFLENQYKMASAKGKTGAKAVFWVASTLSPLLSRL